MNVLALALIVWSCAQVPDRVQDARPGRHVAQSYSPTPPLTAAKKAWFEQAIDRILRGD